MVRGDTHLGGEDINNIVFDHVLQSIAKKHGPLSLPLATPDMVQLQRAVEAAKVALSTDDETELRLTNVGHVALHEMTLTRRKLDALCDPLFKKYVLIIQARINA